MRRLINRHPDTLSKLLLTALPFVLVFLAYAVASEARLAVNPDDKILPGWSTIEAAIQRMAFLPDLRTGDYLLLTDTMASLQRLAIGVGIATLIGGAGSPMSSAWAATGAVARLAVKAGSRGHNFIGFPFNTPGCWWIYRARSSDSPPRPPDH